MANKTNWLGLAAVTLGIAAATYGEYKWFNALVERNKQARMQKATTLHTIAKPVNQFCNENDLETRAEVKQNLFNDKLVVIDAGHGGCNTKKGYDSGAKGYGLEEADLNLDMAKRVGSKLKQLGIRVAYTRESKTNNFPLSARNIYANENKADVFLSLHVNATLDGKARGPIAYFYPGSVVGSNLALRVIAGLNSSMSDVPDYKVNATPVRPENFSVLRNSRVPAVLAETGFISNPNDCKILTKNQNQIAEGIANAVKEYLSSN